jgi:hypothetical protein
MGSHVIFLALRSPALTEVFCDFPQTLEGTVGINTHKVAATSFLILPNPSFALTLLLNIVLINAADISLLHKLINKSGILLYHKIHSMDCYVLTNRILGIATINIASYMNSQYQAQQSINQ